MLNYFRHPGKPDKILSNYCMPVFTNKGYLLFFSKDCLHGATKPITMGHYSLFVLVAPLAGLGYDVSFLLKYLWWKVWRSRV